jgi:hypothetical protein
VARIVHVNTLLHAAGKDKQQLDELVLGPLVLVHCGAVAAAGCDARIVGRAGTLVRPGRLEIATKKRS